MSAEEAKEELWGNLGVKSMKLQMLGYEILNSIRYTHIRLVGVINIVLALQKLENNTQTDEEEEEWNMVCEIRSSEHGMPIAPTNSKQPHLLEKI